MTGTVQEPRDLGLISPVTVVGSSNTACAIAPCSRPTSRLQGRAPCTGWYTPTGRVRGVHYTQAGETHCLALIRSRRWRTAIADASLAHDARYPAPEVTTIGLISPMPAASSVCRRPTTSRSGCWCLLAHRRIFPMDHFGDHRERTWHVTLMGALRELSPARRRGLLGLCKALHTPKLHNLIKTRSGWRTSTAYRFPTSLRHHYERLTTFPKAWWSGGCH